MGQQLTGPLTEPLSSYMLGEPRNVACTSSLTVIDYSVYESKLLYMIMLKHGLSWKMDTRNLNVHTISISKTSLSTRALARALIKINIKIILIANTYNYLSHALFHL